MAHSHGLSADPTSTQLIHGHNHCSSEISVLAPPKLRREFLRAGRG